MTFYAGWSGLGSEYPGLDKLDANGDTAFCRPAVAVLDAVSADHASRIDQVLAAFAAAYSTDHVSFSLSGFAQQPDTGGVHTVLSLSLTTRPATEEEKQMPWPEDPFAPAPAQEQASQPADPAVQFVSGEPEASQATPEPAAEEQPDDSAVPEPAIDGGAQETSDPTESSSSQSEEAASEPSTAADAPSGSEPDAIVPSGEPADPTPVAESAGPTETEPESPAESEEPHALP